MQPGWNRAKRTRVGILVIGSVVLFIGLLVFLVGVSLGSKHVSYYVMTEENVKGLVVGSRVNFQGVPVGSVKDIRFQGGKTRVQISFDPERAVIQDATRARLDRAWVTGQVTIELEGYQRGAKALRPGSTVQAVPSPLRALAQELPDMAAQARELVTEWQGMAANLNRLLGGENGKNLTAVIAHTEELLGALPRQLEMTNGDLRVLMEESRATMSAFRRSAESLAKLADDEDFHGTLAGARLAVERFADVEVQMTGLLRELRGVVGSARSPLLSTLAAAQEAMAELGGLARQLEFAPSSLIFGRTVRERAVPGATPGGSGR